MDVADVAGEQFFREFSSPTTRRCASLSASSFGSV
jgi:hypothetical protein